MQIIAAGEDPAPGETLTEPASPNGRFHAVVIIEQEWTLDGRWFENLSPRPGDALPFMADDVTHDAHLESTLVGNFDRWEKIGNEWHGWGPYLAPPTDEAAAASESWQRVSYLIEQIKAGKLPGISCDVEPIEFEVLFPVMSEEESAAAMEAMDNGEPDPNAEQETDEDGQTYDVIPMSQMVPKLRVTEGRIMGATALPFPAYDNDQVWVEDDSGALVAAAARAIYRAGLDGVVLDGDVSLTAAAPAIARTNGPRESSPSRFSFPDIPPVEWFEVPETPGPMPLTILDSGQVFGHLAIWGECHIGIGGECVEPPPSTCNYARFHVGETPVAPDGRVATGRLTFATGHADLRAGADAARAHYDNSGTVAASLVAMDGEYGIWVCGAMRSRLSLAQVREVMECPPSGDWRRFGRDLELVAALCVNVPGYNTRRDLALAAGGEVEPERSFARVRKEDGLVASLIVSHPAPPRSGGIAAAYGQWANDQQLARSLIARIAASVGRSPQDRIAAAARRVHR